MDFSELNAGAIASQGEKWAQERATVPPADPKRAVLVLGITGQIRGGKNAMGITRTGRHYAKAPFKLWRDAAVSELRAQLPNGWVPISEPVNIRLDYFAGDHRRRDMPAILDAIWHALEKAGVVEDDTLLWVAESSRQYDKSAPRAVITFLQGEENS